MARPFAPTLRHALLDVVPDAPRTLELRALLLDPHAEVEGTPQGAVVTSRLHQLVALFGEPEGALVAARLSDVREPWTLLAPAPRDDLPPGWTWERAVLMTLAAPAALAAARAEARDVVPLTPALLADAPPVLAAELRAALARGPVTCALVDGRAVSFAYAPLRTETLFDLAVDTLEAFRGRRLARHVAAVQIERETRDGRAPVWGAVESNAASLRTSRALGFVAVDELWVATPSDD